MAKPSSDWLENNRDLDLNAFKIVYEEYRSIFDFETPYPPFDELEKESIDGITTVLASVSFTTADGQRHYNFGIETAAAYLYFLNKKHALENGNKRVSLVGLFAYLRLNGKWLKTAWREVYDISKRIAISEPKDIDAIMSECIQFISKNLINYAEDLREAMIKTSDLWYKSFETKT